MNTWKNSIEPTPEDITKLNTIENIINNLFESPTYGTRQQITNHEIIKAMVSVIRNYKTQDCSHYDGYSSEKERELYTHPKHKKTSLYFKSEQLFTNYGPIECKLNDPEFNGMRINVYGNNEIQILFDFYNEKFGYSMKCVIFNVITKSPIVDQEQEEVKMTSLAVHYIGKNKGKNIGKIPAQEKAQKSQQQITLF